jgi:hypothetical protein
VLAKLVKVESNIPKIAIAIETISKSLKTMWLVNSFNISNSGSPE